MQSWTERFLALFVLLNPATLSFVGRAVFLLGFCTFWNGGLGFRFRFGLGLGFDLGRGHIIFSLA